MNKQHIPIPIEGFDRRPRKPQPYILSEVIEISDEESNGEPSVRRPKNLDFVKREPAGNDTTDSEISVPIDVINAKKKNKKKKEKRVMKKLVKKILKEKKKLKKELKKELNTSEETSNSDSDGSYDDSKRSGNSSSSLNSDSSSDSSDHGNRRKRSHHRSKKNRLAGKKRHKSANRNRKTKIRRNSGRVKREKEKTDENRSSDSTSSPDRSSNGQNNSNRVRDGDSSVMDVEFGETIQNYSRHLSLQYDSSIPETPPTIPSMPSNYGQNNSNQVPDGISSLVDVEFGTSIQNNQRHSNSQYDFAIPEILTQLITVSTATTANENGHGTQTLDQIVPRTRYVDDGEVAGASVTSRRYTTLDERDKLLQFVADSGSAQDFSIIENLNEQQSDFNQIVHGAGVAIDQNDFQLILSDTEQPVEQLSEINVERSAGRRQLSPINLQRPRPNTDQMLYLTNPERANVCVFCYDSCSRIVNHYKRKHNTEEVYVSRISPKMAKRLRENDFKRFEANCEKKGSIWILHAKCFFCEYPRSFNFSYWLDHIRSHTGEYARQCQSCGANVSSQEHCGSATDLIRERHNLASTDLMCFLCKHCNFVQMERKNMLRHLIKQHSFQNNVLKSMYDEKMLLPSKITVDKENAPVIAQAANGIDSQGNARNTQVLDEIFLNPFNNNGVPELNTQVPANTSEPSELTKRESGWEERLEIFYPNYITDDNNEIVVNPWLENTTRKMNIFPANLFDFYKCMGPNCIFSTNEKTVMQEHMKDHCLLQDIAKDKKDPIDIHKKCRKCPYCYLGPFKSVHELLEHMETIHSSCTYQCSHCYYRCIEMDSIVLHYEKFHTSKEKNIYVVNNERKFGLDKMERMLNVEDAKDPEKTTQFHEFECCYCDFESSVVDEMRNHLADHHSSEFMFVLRRGEKNIYIHVGARSQWTNFKFFKCGEYKEMEKYLDWDQQNYQPDPFPFVPLLRINFEFEPTELQIAEDVKFVYQKYEYYRKSQTLLFRCGQYEPEYFIQNPQERPYFCVFCLEINPTNEFDLKQHKKTHCYFTAEREDLILQHMQRKHCDKAHFEYRKFQRKNESEWNESLIKCSFACGSCSNQKFLTLEKAWDHHKRHHRINKKTSQIEILLNDERISFSFREYMFCKEKTIDCVTGKKECSVPMTESQLKKHHAEYHANEGKIIYCKHKLVLCKNNEIIPSETE